MQQDNRLQVADGYLIGRKVKAKLSTFAKHLSVKEKALLSLRITLGSLIITLRICFSHYRI